MFRNAGAGTHDIPEISARPRGGATPRSGEGGKFRATRVHLLCHRVHESPSLTGHLLDVDGCDRVSDHEVVAETTASPAFLFRLVLGGRVGIVLAEARLFSSPRRTLVRRRRGRAVPPLRGSLRWPRPGRRRSARHPPIAMLRPGRAVRWRSKPRPFGCCLRFTRTDAGDCLSARLNPQGGGRRRDPDPAAPGRRPPAAGQGPRLSWADRAGKHGANIGGLRYFFFFSGRPVRRHRCRLRRRCSAR